MPIATAIIADYAPWGNAELAFEVPADRLVSVDPTTGNFTQDLVTVEYLAAIKLQVPSWSAQSGVDSTVYSCSGRLLHPTKLDPRITNGSQAFATINGYRGRFELVFDLAMDAYHRATLRQSIGGIFRVVGGPA
jgi:hypothetical protein